MTPFEFVAVFFSVILGLGVTHFLSALSDLIEVRTRVKASWAHGILALAVLLLLIHSWWGMWGLRDVKAWSYAGFLSMVAYLSALYLLSTLVFPKVVEERDIDLWQHYMSVRPMLHSVFALVFLMAALLNYTLFGSPITSVFVMVPVVCSGADVVGVITSNRHYHRFLAIAFLLGILAIMITDQTVLQ